MSPPDAATTDRAAALDAQIAAAERDLAAQAGGASLCRIDQDGRAGGGVKYHEGRLVALMAARRRLRALGDAAAPEAQHTALAAELADWRQALREQEGRATPAPAWLAYRQGGVAALAQLAEAPG